jgi:hypothetical protein
VHQVGFITRIFRDARSTVHNSELQCVNLSINNILKLLLLAVTSFNFSSEKVQPRATKEINAAEGDYLGNIPKLLH